MRGRTNAEPNIGVQLNATTDTYEVAPDETILAGDFTETFIEIDGGIEASSNPIFRLSDGKYLIGTKLYIDNGDHSFSEFGTSGVSYSPTYQLNVDEFLCIYRYEAYLIKYDAEHEYCISKSFSVGLERPWSNDYFSLKILELAQKKYIFFVNYLNYSRTYRINHLFEVTISGTNYDDYTVSTNTIDKTQDSVSEVGYTYYPTGAALQVAQLGNNDYLTWRSRTTRSSASSEPTTQYIYNRYKNKTSYSPNNMISYYVIPDTITSDGYMVRLFRSNDDLYYQYGYFDKDDATIATTYTSVKIAEFPDASGNNYIFKALKIDSDKDGYDRYIIVQCVNYIYITMFEMYISLEGRNVITGEFTKISNTVRLTTDDIYLFIRGQNDYLITLLGNLYEVTIDNHIVKAQINTHNYVRTIHSRTYSMGVAKQSGTAGDTIEVYIPQVNS